MDCKRFFMSLFSSFFFSIIEDVRMHDLRHTFASMAIKSGLGLYQVSKLLGHKNIQTTMRYAHIEKEELVKSAKAVEAVFANV